jgi:hypothetical protein
MKVTRNNYEPILIDYLDGKLSAAEVEEVLLFLALHPEIKEEVEGMEGVCFPEEKTAFDAATLYKPLYPEVKKTYEQLLVARLEGDLSMEDQQRLQYGFTVYPEMYDDARLFSYTRFSPEKNTVFPYKQQLKKGNLFVLHRQTILRIAAVVLLISVIGIFTSRLTRQSRPQLAQQENPKPAQGTASKAEKTTPTSTQTPVTETKTTVHPSVPPSPGVKPHHPLTLALITHKEHRLPIAANTSQIITPFTSPARLAYAIPEPVATEDKFIPLTELLRERVTHQLEQKTKTAFRDLNKTAGVSIQKDSSGRIRSVEIAALGLAWSQTK